MQKIYLVEDDATIVSVLADYLRQWGYECYPAKKFAEILQEFRAVSPDLILLDISLPYYNGYHWCQEIRNISEVPIIFLSSMDQQMNQIMAMNMGADDYLTKPFAAKELLARIRAMTRNQTIHSDSQLHVGNITLDSVSFELSSPSGSFRLANKEYQMMELLIRNPKNMISTEHFMERIWGFDSETEIKVVWVYISYLRKKLEALHADIQIRVTRNIGYSLEEIK